MPGSFSAYLAAPIFDQHQLAVVDRLYQELQLRDFNVFSPYHASQDIFRGRPPSECTAEERALVIQGNISNLHCWLLLAWVGGYEAGFTDPGVIWEMGYAAALSGAPAAWNNSPLRPLTLAYIDESDKRQSMNLMLSATVDVVVKGIADLRIALQLARLCKYEALRERYHPRKVLGGEMEPVV